MKRINHTKAKLLILEDDKLFAQTLEDFLSDEEFDVDIVSNGEELIDKSYESSYDLLLLDINTPKVNGLQALKYLRDGGDQTPAIFITSYQEKKYLEDGFKIGGDDYLKKPIDLDELLLRIFAILKRTTSLDNCFYIGDILYNKKRCSLMIGNQEYFLSDKKALLLDLLIQNRSKLVSKKMIFDRLWSWQEEPSESALRVYISSLKQLLGNDKIKNIKGIGYILEF